MLTDGASVLVYEDEQIRSVVSPSLTRASIIIHDSVFAHSQTGKRGRQSSLMISQHDTGPRKPSIPLEVFKRLRPGDSITYLLSHSQGPTNPHREWHGRVECVLGDHVMVASLDEGYLEETERVCRSEIIVVQHRESYVVKRKREFISGGSDTAKHI